MEPLVDFKLRVKEYENSMADFYRNSLLGLEKTSILYFLATIWDTFSLSGAKRRHQYKIMMSELEELKEKLGTKEYRGLKLRIKTAFEN